MTTIPAWVLMWSLAAAMFAAAKVGTAIGATGSARLAGYFALWPGLDARRFLDRKAVPAAPAASEWAAALLKIALGAALFWVVARRLPPLAAAWTGMTGLILMLHCGVFHAISIAWRTAGVEARPIMDSPLLAESVADFWSGRWNRAFHDLALALVYRPLRRPIGPAGATMAVFAASGLVHELLISLPARAGWGLPTGYFLLQGLAVLAERKLPAAWRRPFAWLVVGLPAFALFHPPFVERVVLPMMQALGALR